MTHDDIPIYDYFENILKNIGIILFQPSKNDECSVLNTPDYLQTNKTKVEVAQKLPSRSWYLIFGQIPESSFSQMGSCNGDIGIAVT
jgi:hypothetical protein